jgi:hypothetical protein
MLVLGGLPSKESAMGLGPTLVGGAIGALLGVGLHLLVETTTSFEAAWFAIVIGLLTGLGVNQANKSLAGRVSYLRGAIAAAIALAAIVGSPMMIAKVVASDRAKAPAGDRRELAADDEEAGESESGPASSDPITLADAETDHPLRDALDGGNNLEIARPGEFNVWQFVFMAVGTFIAYELGRGTGKPTPPADSVVTTDPTN